jgi:hypothetical protein
MDTLEHCRRQVDQVKEASVSTEAAYLARTRLKRTVLSCSRMISRRYGLPEPELPSSLSVPPDSSRRVRKIAGCCNRLVESAGILCQPSEPLDSRWKTGWDGVRKDLDELDSLLANEESDRF